MRMISAVIVPDNIIYNWRIERFEGLKIVNIDYCFGIRLHFNFFEWYNNIKCHENVHKRGSRIFIKYL